jgi:hypothetical protein
MMERFFWVGMLQLTSKYFTGTIGAVDILYQPLLALVFATKQLYKCQHNTYGCNYNACEFNHVYLLSIIYRV